MKYLKQLVIILLFSFLGELLQELLPLPVPAAIYGLLLLFLALTFKIVKPESIKTVAGRVPAEYHAFAVRGAGGQHPQPLGGSGPGNCAHYHGGAFVHRHCACRFGACDQASFGKGREGKWLSCSLILPCFLWL